MSSNQTTQQLEGIVFSRASVDKKHTMKDETLPSHSSSAYLSSLVCLDVLIGWRDNLVNCSVRLGSLCDEVGVGVLIIYILRASFMQHFSCIS